MTPAAASFCVCLVQPKGYAHSLGLREVCDLLCRSIETLGHPCLFQVNGIQEDAINIIVGYQMLGPGALARLKGRLWAAYQLEQLSEDEGCFRKREHVLRAAPVIWDYSPENIAFLTSRGFNRVEYLALGFHPQLKRIPHRAEPAKDIDVLFYGALNNRRAAMLQKLHSRCRLEALFGIYGADRDQYIARSRIILNVHFYQARIIEQVRLAYLLNNECFIVSEDAGQNPFEGGLVTGSYDELPPLCEQYLADPEQRRAIAARGSRAFEQRPMVEHLRPRLAALLTGDTQ